MLIEVKNINSKKVMFKKATEGNPLLPSIGAGFRLEDGSIARVIDIEYFLSKESLFSYERIEIFVEVFENK